MASEGLNVLPGEVLPGQLLMPAGLASSICDLEVLQLWNGDLGTVLLHLMTIRDGWSPWQPDTDHAVREFHNHCQAHQSESLPLCTTPPPNAHLPGISHMLGEHSVTGLYVSLVLSL